MGQYDRKKESQPKHGKPSDSGASRAPPPMSRSMPEWKGSGYTPKKKSKQPVAKSAAPEALKLEHALPVKLEQTMLEIFRTTFPASSEFEALKPMLQEIKDALLDRDYKTAFGRDEFREAYTIRWSPSRALAYAQLLAWICAERASDSYIQRLVGRSDDTTAASAVCFGGSAAEIMAFSGLLHHIRPSEAAGKPSASTDQVAEDLKAMQVSEPNPGNTLLQLKFLDVADWASVLSKLQQGLETVPTLSKYASAAVRARNASFLMPGAVEHIPRQGNILDTSMEDLRSIVGTTPALLTFMLTLNELYTASIPRTTAFLSRLTEATPKGSLLLVVDTPGSYTEIAVAGAEDDEEKRKYPMHWLLDHALVPKLKKDSRIRDHEEKPPHTWEKVLEESNVLYRLDEGLRHPASLENMKLQVHLFKRI